MTRCKELQSKSRTGHYVFKKQKIFPTEKGKEFGKVANREDTGRSDGKVLLSHHARYAICLGWSVASLIHSNSERQFLYLGVEVIYLPMPFARSFRANTACRARQLASRQPTPLHTIPLRLAVSPGFLVAHQLASQRSFTSSRLSSARSSPLLYHPRWPNNKSDDPADAAESEESEAAESEGKKSGHVSMESSQDEGPAGSSASSPPSSSSGDDSDPADSQPPPPQRTPTPSSIAKQSVPEIYPQVLALPIARRPLFPGFYKAVVVRNPAVVAAIKEMMKRGQPYLGAFLLKDENTDSDVITDINSVHPVGVFAQITSVFSANTGSGEEKEEGLTAVLYPHRRIQITELLKAGEHPALAKVAPEDVQTVTPPESPPPSPSPDYAQGEVSKVAPGKS